MTKYIYQQMAAISGHPDIIYGIILYHNSNYSIHMFVIYT